MSDLFVAAGGLDEEKKVSIAEIVRLISKEPEEIKNMGEEIVKMAKILGKPYDETFKQKLGLEEGQTVTRGQFLRSF